MLNIIHCDLDAFFAAVEQRDNPALKNKPVIVGGSADARGVVSTCSYEAREFGVRSAMPIGKAVRLCPQGVFLPVDMKKYQEASRQVFSIFAGYTPILEALSIDEAFLEIGGSTGLFGTPEHIAADIKQRVKNEVGLIISIGISYNKFLAKLATELGKPDGLFIIRPEEALNILSPLPVSFLWGVGDKTRRTLEAMGINTIQELRDMPVNVLEKRLGSQAAVLHELASGIDYRLIETDWEAKSMGREHTFEKDISDPQVLDTKLLGFAQILSRRLRDAQKAAQGVTIKLRFHDFKTITRSKTLAQASNSETVIYNTASELLRETGFGISKVRLIGLTVNRLCRSEINQASLFAESESGENLKLDQAVDKIRKRFGEQSITRASLLGDNNDDNQL